MAIAEHDLPPYDVRELLAAPFPERVRLVCRSWAAQVGATPLAVIGMYWAKYLLLFVGGWAFFVWLSDAPDTASLRERAFSGVAFQKAILWAIFYELLGLGCGSGPMNGRFWPPLGGFLHFLRPGTVRLPALPRVPGLRGTTRGAIDVALYAVAMLSLLRALVAPEVTPALLWPFCVLLPVMGLRDQTLFLAARGEHYFVALLCLAVAGGDGPWIAGCKVVWLFIWFWASVSKANHHFPSVIMVMMNNGPFFPAWLKRRLFVDPPDDLRPSRFAAGMATMGALTEFSIPFALLASRGSPEVTAVVLVVMACFHGFIALNNPSGMPIEWNLVMIYGGIFLFGANPDPSPFAIAELPIFTGFLLLCLFVVPLVGNLFPGRVSFLLAMRYYAGNWAYNIWLFRGESAKKLHRVKKAAPLMREQLERMLDDPLAVDAAMAMSCAHRFMHLEGRPLLDALPRAARRIDDYEWMDGEIVGGLVLGWNFGDGHLNGRRLLEAVQARCDFLPGELRVVSVESQPLFGRTMQWQVFDAAEGLVARGETEIGPMRSVPPWPTGSRAEALVAPRTDDSPAR